MIPTINTPTLYTKDMLKGYKYFVSGWVGDVCVREVSRSKVILTGKVRNTTKALDCCRIV